MPERVIIRKPEKQPDTGEYYLGLAQRCRFFKFLTLGLLVAFAVLMLLLFRSSVTYENLQYMLRDLSSAASKGNFSSVNFDSDGSAITDLFRGDLAVVTPKNVTLYSSGGSRGLSKSLTYSSPVLKVSDRYFLIYDSAGDAFSVYNSYSKLYSESLGSNIYGADVSDSGAFAILTSTREYPYVIYVYNKDFRRIKEYDRNRQVVGVRLSPDGEALLIISFSAENGSYVTELSAVFLSGNSEPVSVNVRGAFPMAAEWTEEGFALVCDDGMYFYSKDGSLITSRDYGAGTPRRFSLGRHSLAVISEKNGKHTENDVVLFDSRGNILYNGMVYGELFDCAVSKTGLFVLTEDEVFSIDSFSADGNVKKCANPGGDRLLIYTALQSSVPMPVVCGDGTANGISFD